MNKEEMAKINFLFNKLQFSNEDKESFWEIVNPIINHEEYKKRLDAATFPHHDNISLGTHMISDAIVTYWLAKRRLIKNKNIDLKTAVVIAMFHDLYERPWQNSHIVKNRTINRHGFTHPIEAVINAATWFPNYFNNTKTSEIIIDGIMHHMYPFPVRSITKDFEDTEINNLNKITNLDNDILDILIKSSLRHKIGDISLAKSKYIEGRVLSKADKFITFKNDLKSFNSIKACLTGNNPDLNNTQHILKK